MNREKDITYGIYTAGSGWGRIRRVRALTERVIRVLLSVTRNNAADGPFRGTHVPVTRSNAS